MAKKKSVKPSETDNTDTPNQGFLVAGIGASAGGVEALKEFFTAMPENPGMAFVVVLHLSPQHESSLAAILQACTKLPVTQVTKMTKVTPNHVYVIPPNKNLEMIDGVIRLAKPEKTVGIRVVIDLFFRTLAEAYGRNAIGIVLSGTGSDGTSGLKRIKENNGFAIVQDPDDAEYDSMPRSALATNLVDWILPAKEMPARLVAYRVGSDALNMTSDDPHAAVDIKGGDDLRDILTLIRVRTGHDFSNYKQATLLRRIARHLQIYGLDDIRDYLALLREKPEDMHLLVKNLLINVTNFFRDKEAFESLEKEVIPQLFAGKTGKDSVRVWSAACASGEEAYSIGMLLSEYASRLNDPPKIQIFATDVDDDAIAESREHRYPETIEADVSPERLRRFFVKESGYYRVRKDLRELILFAPHNVLRDPPFSRLDLVSCRNLLIYLNRETQDKVLQIFHFALVDGGHLFLGNSESAESQNTHYAPVDKKQRIYSRRTGAMHGLKAAPILPIESNWEMRIPDLQRPPERDRSLSFGEMHYKLVESYAPPSVLVNQDFDIVHLSESAGRFLRFTGGEPSSSLLKAVNPDLLPDLRAALFSAQREGKTAEFQNIGINIEGKAVTVNLIVKNVEIADAGRDFLLVIFDETTTSPELTEDDRTIITDKDDAMESVVRKIEEELRRTKERLRSTIEQHETSIEELKASNEELQAINEELRSASEELETSKEELQSVNEELTTVNHELKEKIDETGRINSDLQNLMAATDIATIFLDKDMRIKRYTPPTEELFNITRTDIGRPLEHFTHRLRFEELVVEAENVLKNLRPVERQIESIDYRFYLSRFLPYRTVDDRIEGVVLNFIDITERKLAEEALKDQKDQYRALFNSMDEGVVTIELIYDNDKVVDFVYLEHNKALARQTGLTSEIVGKRVSTVSPELEDYWFEAYEQVAKTGKSVRREFYVTAQECWFDVYISRVGGEGSRVIVSVYNNITDRKRREKNLAFLAEVSDHLADLESIDETIAVLGEKMGEYYKASLVAFSSISDDAKTMSTDYAWNRQGVPSTIGEHLIGDYHSEDFVRAGLAGQRYVVRDVSHDPRMNAENMAKFGAAAFMSIPIVHNGKWQFSLSVADTAPRDWREDEIELLGELTARIRARLERAYVAEAVSESEERFRLLATAASEITYRMSADWSKMISLEGKKFLADTSDPKLTWLEEYIPDSDKKVVQAAISRSIKNKSKFELEHRVIRADGEVGWVFSRAVPLLNKQGRIVEWFGAASDTTERRATVEALVASEERYRSLFNSIDEGFCTIEVIFNKRGKAVDYQFIEINPAFSRQSGLEDVLGRTVREFVPSHEEFWFRTYGEIARTGEAMRFEHEAKELGRYFDVYAFHAGEPGSNRVAILFTDISERKVSEETIRRSEGQLQMIMESTRDYAIITFDLKGMITRWNTGAERIFGYEKDEILGRHGSIIFTPEDRAKKVPEMEMTTALEKGRAEDERFHLRKDGTRFFMSGVMQPLIDGKLKGFVKIARDLTERVAAEGVIRERETLKQLVMAQEDERKRIARDLHDQMGQKLTALRLKLASVKELAAGNADVVARVERLQEIGEDIDAEVNFLAWELRPTALDDLGLVAAIGNYVSEWSKHYEVPAAFHSTGLKGVRLEPEVETNLYRITQEALNNTSKHANASSINVLIERRKDEVVLIIEDDGKGFDITQTPVSSRSGRGLGLVGIHERASIANGRAEIESTPGSGTTIFVTVPFNPPQQKGGKE